MARRSKKPKATRPGVKSVDPSTSGDSRHDSRIEIETSHNGSRPDIKIGDTSRSRSCSSRRSARQFNKDTGRCSSQSMSQPISQQTSQQMSQPSLWSKDSPSQPDEMERDDRFGNSNERDEYLKLSSYDSTVPSQPEPLGGIIPIVDGPVPMLRSTVPTRSEDQKRNDGDSRVNHANREIDSGSNNLMDRTGWEVAIEAPARTFHTNSRSTSPSRQRHVSLNNAAFARNVLKGHLRKSSKVADRDNGTYQQLADLGAPNGAGVATNPFLFPDVNTRRQNSSEDCWVKHVPNLSGPNLGSPFSFPRDSSKSRHESRSAFVPPKDLSATESVDNKSGSRLMLITDGVKGGWGGWDDDRSNWDRKGQERIWDRERERQWDNGSADQSGRHMEERRPAFSHSRTSGGSPGRWDRFQFNLPKECPKLSAAHSIFNLDVESFIRSITEFDVFRLTETEESSVFSFRNFLSPLQILSLLIIAQSLFVVILHFIFSSSSIGREMRSAQHLVNTSGQSTIFGTFKSEDAVLSQARKRLLSDTGSGVLESDVLLKSFAKPGLLTVLTCLGTASLFFIDIAPDLSLSRKSLRFYLASALLRIGPVLTPICNWLGLDAQQLGFVRHQETNVEEELGTDQLVSDQFGTDQIRIDHVGTDQNGTSGSVGRRTSRSFESMSNSSTTQQSQPSSLDLLSNNTVVISLLSPVGAMLGLPALFEVLAIWFTYLGMVALPFGSWLCLNTVAILGLGHLGGRVLNRRSEFFHRSGIIFVSVGCGILWVIHATLLSTTTLQIIQLPPPIDVMDTTPPIFPPQIPASPMFNQSVLASTVSSVPFVFIPGVNSIPTPRGPTPRGPTPNQAAPSILSESSTTDPSSPDNLLGPDIVSAPRSTIDHTVHSRHADSPASSMVSTSSAQPRQLLSQLPLDFSNDSLPNADIPNSDIPNVDVPATTNGVPNIESNILTDSKLHDTQTVKRVDPNTPVAMVMRFASGRRTLLCLVGQLARTVSVTLQELIQVGQIGRAIQVGLLMLALSQ